MENANNESIDEVIAYAKSLPDFPMKAVIVQRLETQNLNRYQQALMTLNEVIVEYDDPSPDSSGNAVTKQQLQELVNKIARMESTDQVAE